MGAHCNTQTGVKQAMRNIMRVGVAVLALLVATDVAGAQGGGGGGGGRGRGGAGQVTRLMENITLSDAQKAKTDTIVIWFDAESAKLPAMGRGGDGPPPDSATRANAMAARTKLTTEFRDKLKAVLTPEQQKTFDENVAKMPVGGGRRGGA
jgi:Spy/CpxP family protein refolding chaperone